MQQDLIHNLPGLSLTWKQTLTLRKNAMLVVLAWSYTRAGVEVAVAEGRLKKAEESVLSTLVL